MLFPSCPSCSAPHLISICCFLMLSVRLWGQAPLFMLCRREHEWDCALPVSCTLMGAWEAEPQLLLLGKLLLWPWFTHSQIPRCCLWKQSTLKCLFCLKMRSRAELSAEKNCFITPYIAFKRPGQNISTISVLFSQWKRKDNLFWEMELWCFVFVPGKVSAYQSRMLSIRSYLHLHRLW